MINLFQKLKDSEARVDELEAAALANLPMDSAKEFSSLKMKLKSLEEEKDGHLKEKVSLEANNKELKSKIKSLEKSGQTTQTSSVKFEVL